MAHSDSTSSSTSATPAARGRRRGLLQRACPQCGAAALLRLARGEVPAGGEPPPSGEASGRRTRRHTAMRCTAPGCGFEGWVPRRSRRRRTASAGLGWARVAVALRPWLVGAAVLGLVGAVAAMGATVGAALERANTPSATVQRQTLPPGEYHDGDPLPAAHALLDGRQPAPLDLRASCVWGRPGRQPFQGTAAEVLRSARLPAEVQAALLAQLAAGRPSGRVVIGNDGIHDAAGGRRFDARGFAMSYGRTLCLETRVNFVPGHTEPADLYEAQDRTGRRYWMMIPEVCGNVSLIGETRRGASGELAFDAPGAGLPDQLRLGPRPKAGDPTGPHRVPLPGSAALAALALAAAGLAGWRGARRPGVTPAS
jgi:hypothetical protein